MSDLEYVLTKVFRLLTENKPEANIVSAVYGFVTEMAEEVGLNLHWEGKDE